MLQHKKGDLAALWNTCRMGKNPDVSEQIVASILTVYADKEKFFFSVFLNSTHPEDGGNDLPRNISKWLPVYMAS